MNYYPFGMLQPGRHANTSDYRYGFQGQEMDDEIKGEGNSINYKFRMHDPRVGRFFAMDPLTSKYPFYSPYSFSGNRVLDMIEQEGLEPDLPEYLWSKSKGYEFLGDYYNQNTTIQVVQGYWVQSYMDNEMNDKYQYYNPEKESWLSFYPVTPTSLYKELSDLATESIPDAGEINAQGSVKIGPGTRYTFGVSLFHADDGFALGVNHGIEVSTDNSLYSFDGLNINVFYAHYGKELSTSDFSGREKNVSGDIPLELFNLGLNYAESETYTGAGLNFNTLSKPSFSMGITESIMLFEQNGNGIFNSPNIEEDLSAKPEEDENP
ncbi:RHS repeat domain-containing protein [Aequorivita antarctica]|uniref:RHS repeat domain-containing protein n=1 Tax=Aequorivita antarctica TaxID=153266 RepID=UPI0011BFD9E7|nr:RHS repeat-associated core domain-containing protein [Aequorivita antarctica]